MVDPHSPENGNQAMSTEIPHQDALKFIVQLQAAIRTVRLYPSSNPLVRTSITALQSNLDRLLKSRDAFVLAESENILIVDGTPLDEKAQKKDQVLALRALLQHLGLQSVGFTRGLAAGELRKAVELLGADTKTLQARPFLEIAAQKQLPHLQFNQKVYVALDPERQLLQSLPVKDEEILEFFKKEGQSEAPSMEEIRRLAANPRWIAEVFVSGLKRVAAQTGPAPNTALSEAFTDLLKSVDQVIDRRDWEKVTTHLAREVVQADIDTIFAVAVQDVEKHLGASFLNLLAQQLDAQRFEQLVDKLEHAAGNQGPHAAGLAKAPLETAIQTLMRSAKGQQLKKKRADIRTGKRQARQQRMAFAAEAVKKMQGGDFSSLDDPDTLENIPELAKTLLDGSRHKPADQLLDTLARGMLKAPPGKQTDLLQILEKIADEAGAQRYPEAMASVAEQLCTWLKLQSNYTPEAAAVCQRLAKLAAEFIDAKDFARAAVPLATLREVADGTQREDALCQACRKQIEGLASDDRLARLVEKMQSSESQPRAAASQILTNLGPVCAEQLLDILRQSTNARDRLHILGIIAHMGPGVAPALVRRLQQQGPWYYLRNLVRLLGEIGSETHLDALVPLLDHDDFRVKWEVLASIYKIGGRRRGKILLEQLPLVEDRLKLQVVSLLGGLHCREAVPALIDLLKRKSLRRSQKKALLQVKICAALGKIGSSLAVPALSEISQGRRASIFASYHPSVKAAAGEALNTLQRSLKTGIG